MRHITLSVLVMITVVYAAWAPAQEDAEGESDKERVETVEPSKSADNEPQKPDDKEWPPPFVPSEEVGADSVISFPTDI